MVFARIATQPAEVSGLRGFLLPTARYVWPILPGTFGLAAVAQQVFRYKAFISYRHLEQDRKWARWLVERLETFRAPRSLVQAGIPSRIGKLFRDDDEIPASSDLSQQIQNALQASQFLIVVCSRATPLSKWVRKEIDYFRTLGRGDHILALLIDGEPGEAFPENLLYVPHERTAPDGSTTVEWQDSEPIAADVRDRPGERRKDLERRAFLRIAAGLLGCTFDDLFRRERQRQKRRQNLLGSALAVIVLAMAGALYFWWDYYVPKVAYYAEFGTRWGVPFGVGPLGHDSVTHRSASYEITSERHEVVLMRRVAGSGALRPLSGDGYDSESLYKGIAVWRVYYQDNHVKTIELADDEGNLVRKLDYDFAPDSTSAVELNRSSKGHIGALQAGMFDIVTLAQRQSLQNASQVAGDELRFTPDGLIAVRSFQTAFGDPADAGNGSFGRSYSYYPNGLVRSFRDLNDHGAIHLDEAGIAEVFRKYDTAGDLVYLEWRDAAGRPTMTSHGYARWQARRDGFGNVVHIGFSGPEGNPAINNILQASQFASRIDTHGNDIQDRYFDPQGRPALNPAGFSELRWQYDSQGRAITEECFGTNGHPVLNSSGYFRLTRRYNARGALTTEHYYGLDGRPIIPHVVGWAAVERRFDEDGNPVGQTYLGVNGKPMLTMLGIASVAKKTTARHAELESYFGVRGEPVVRRDYGVSRILRRYDQYGNVVDETYFGVDAKRTTRTDMGVAEISAKYDDRGEVTDQWFFAQNRMPIADTQLGAAHIQTGYSDDGKQRTESYFDANDRPVARRDLKVASITAFFDRHGNEMEEDYFGFGGRRTARAGYGVAIVKRRYDANKNLIEESYFDGGGHPAVRFDRGFSRIFFGYDKRGNCVEEAYFAPDGKPAKNLLGVSKLKRRFDVLGHKLEATYFDVNGYPALRTDGISRMAWRYDAAGVMRELLIYGSSNELRSTFHFDAAGNLLR